MTCKWCGKKIEIDPYTKDWWAPEYEMAWYTCPGNKSGDHEPGPEEAA